MIKRHSILLNHKRGEFTFPKTPKKQSFHTLFLKMIHRKIFLLLTGVFILLLTASTQSCAVRFNKSRGEKVYQKPKSKAVSKQTGLQTAVNGWLGVPYLYGGESKKGVDCSALTQNIFVEAYGSQLPRTAKLQLKMGNKISPALLKKGDLVFFQNSRGVFIDHVGIYLGNDKFVHASRQKGVIISRFSSAYYQKRFIQARRVRF
jgi:lipoprotein Spr